MIRQIPLDEIADNPFQPRQTFDPAAIRSLADVIQAEGFWGPLQARRQNGQFELVFGHRRLRALRQLQQATVAVDVVDLTDAEMALRGLAENVQRKDLTELERADAIAQPVDRQRAQLKGWTS